MAFDGRRHCPMGVPTLLTSEDVSSITIQSLTSGNVWIIGTVGAAVPTSVETGLKLQEGAVILNEYLADLFPGIAGVSRVYAWPESSAADLKVSHA